MLVAGEDAVCVLYGEGDGAFGGAVAVGDLLAREANDTNVHPAFSLEVVEEEEACECVEDLGGFAVHAAASVSSVAS